MTSVSTRDPQFRRYLGLPEDQTTGIYITDTLANGPAALAGIKKGDVLLKVDGQPVDQDGNYKDPDYGKISVSHLFSTKYFDGDSLKLLVSRQGQNQELDLRLAHRPLDSYVIEPYVIDRAPKFYILGGLVLTELSRQFLREYGAEWVKKAPEQFVYIDRQQNELFKNGPKKVVILTRVLPSALTIGYEDLAQLIVTKINDVTLQSLADIPNALTKSVDGLHKIEFDSDPGVIYLNAAETAASEESFSKKYRIQPLQRLE